MKLAAYMVIKDDVFYVDMALKSISPFIEGIYVQDQGSTDGTIELIEKVKKDFSNIVLEIVPHPYPRFDIRYDEVEFRNKALARCIELFNSDWVCKFDSDELMTEHFFNTIRSADLSKYNAICTSESRFISKDMLSADKEAYGFQINGNWYYGGHVTFFRSSLGVRYRKNPQLSSSFHPVFTIDPDPYYWIPGICHPHLHRTFGPKAFDFWAEGGDVFERTNPFNARIMAPKWFNHKINLGTSEKVDFRWPEFVLEKWEKFGIW